MAEAQEKVEKLFTWLDLSCSVRLRYKPVDTLWIDWEIFPHCGHDLGDPKSFYFANDTPGGTKNIEEAKGLSGYLKWDGCMEVEGLDDHYCGPIMWDQQALRITRLYCLCAKIFKNCDYEDELDKAPE